MDRQRQTIELLQLLGDDVAQSVLARLEPEQAARLKANITVKPSDVPWRPRQQRELLDDFEEFLQFALSNEVQKPAIYDSGEDGQSDSAHNIEAQLNDAGDQQQSESENSEHGTAEMPSAATEPPALTGDPVIDLQTLSIYQLAQALETEQPRTTAILLSNLPYKLAADVLSLLPEEFRKVVTKELSREQHAPPILVERIARATLQRGQTLSSAPPDRRQHVDRLADLLRSVARPQRMGMLTAIEEENPELNKALLKRMYRFEDVTSLEPRTIQRIMGEIDGATLTLALYNTTADVREAILGNLSRRARQSIEEELSFQTHVPESRVNSARDTIAEVIARIDQESE
jgi:flagellar motor switch protein FliG